MLKAIFTVLAMSAVSAVAAPLSEPSTEASFLIEAVPLVAKWEGKRNEAYQDIVGVWTICYGHTKGVRSGQRLTDRQCSDLLAQELLEYRTGLRRYFTPETVATLLPAKRDAAFASLAYNVGIRGAGRSTATRRLNAGNVPGACEALTWWNKAGGRVIRGLVRRRTDERKLCLVGAS